MSLYSQPDRTSSNSLELALASMARATDLATGTRATEMLIDAVGNNHAGTYSPEVLDVIPLVQGILQTGSPWAQRALLEALIDLCGSFQPQPGCELYEGKPLDRLLHARVRALSSDIKAVAQLPSAAAGSAADLLAVL